MKVKSNCVENRIDILQVLFLPAEGKRTKEANRFTIIACMLGPLKHSVK
jgi:hypothetical protein